jgi:uncharacterized protein YyaL (SSP411 family)
MYTGTHREIAIVGRRDDPKVAALAGVAFGRFEPNAILGYVDPEDESTIAGLPFLEYRPLQKGLATAYLCEHFSCMPPVHEPEALLAQLESASEVLWQSF